MRLATDRCRRPGDLAPPVVAGPGPEALLRCPVLDVGQGDEVQVLRKRLALEERGAQRSDWYRAVLDAFVLNIKATYEIYRFWLVTNPPDILIFRKTRHMSSPTTVPTY